MRIFIAALLLLAFAHPLDGYGQSPPYINFRGGDQIPSSETYHVIQDRKGFIWIATACGVSRFDGYVFTTFTLKDGLPDNVIHEIYEDYKGRIWFVSSSGQLAYFFNGRIHPYKYNYLMTGIYAGGSGGSIKNAFRVTENEEVVVSVKRKGAFSVSRNGDIKKVYRSERASFTIIQDAGIAPNFISDDIWGNRTGKIELRSRSKKIELISHKDIRGVLASQQFSICVDTNWFISLDANLYCWDGRRVKQQKYANPIVWLSRDNQGLVWVSEFNGGVCCYKNFSFEDSPVLHLFDKLSVTSVLRDREGGYWFTTYTNGLFYVSNIWNKTFFWNSAERRESKIVSVGQAGSSLWIAFENSKLVEVSSDGFVRERVVPWLSSPDLYFSSIVAQPNSSSVWLLSNCFLFEYNGRGGFKRYDNGLEPCLTSLRGIYPRALAFYGGRLLVGTRIGCLILENGRVVYDSYKSGDFKSTVNGMAVSKDETLWLGCSDGLWKFRNGRFEWLGEAFAFFRNRISRVVINPIDSTIWVGTRGGGIGIYNGKTIKFITSDNGLPSDIINSIAMGMDRVWVGSSSGVAQVSAVPDLAGRYNVSGFDKSIGIVSNEILDLIPTDSSIIIGTRDGVLSYKLEDVSMQVKPKVLITSVMVNGRDTVIRDNMDLSYTQNHITISFAGFTFKTLGNTLFRYRLHESDTAFFYTRIPKVVIPALSPGKYTFEVWAQNAYGQWSLEPARVRFTIFPPFWTAPWFVFLASVGAFLAFSLAYTLRLRSLKRTNLLSRKLDGWKQQALLQQMNPHFIFNTLNSIQLFILQNDALSSHRYLTKFAKLMRLTLENSQSFSVSFRSELESLNLYLELEVLRADGKFIYEISVDEDLDMDVTIPSLIVQPFVENAIWHGVMPKESGGKIMLSFRVNGSRVFCVIEDNGIGRAEAEKYASAKAHKSLGSRITMQRLQLLKSMYKQQLGIVYTDLTDGAGQPSGTRVELAIPILPPQAMLD